MFAMGPAFFKSTAGGYATLAVSGAFAAAIVGAPYSSSIPITGGLTPYSLTGGTGVASGTLPAGLSLSISGSTLVLSGTPTTAATSSFTASVDSTDSQTATSAQSVVVSEAGLPVTSGLALWLDPTQLTLADGVILTSWPDLSPAATPTTVSGTTLRMSVSGINGRRTVVNSAAGHLATPIDWTGATGGTIFSVLIDGASNTASGISYYKGPGSNVNWIPWSDGKIYDCNLASGRVGPGSTLSGMLNGFVYTAHVGPSGGKYRFNRADVLTQTYPFAIPAPNLQAVGYCAFDGRTAQQSYGEVLVYTRELTPSEIDSVEAYLAAKWGTP